MGIRGLATFVRSHGCLVETGDFSDSLVIIDGLNLVHRLTGFKEAGMRSPFGGEYCALRDTTQMIIERLKLKNITPVVIFDGGMDSHGTKLRTKLDRHKKAMFRIANVHPGNPSDIFPQFAVDTVIQALRDVGITAYATAFEADGLIAWLAHRFECPVVSDDSDFFVFGVRCITLASLLASCVSEGRGRTFKDGEALEVEMFCPDRFLEQFKLRHEHLAVFGSVLGNDVVPFMDTVSGFSQIAKPKFSTVPAEKYAAKVKNSRKGSMIAGFLKWMSTQKPEDALEKFLGFLRSEKRDTIKAKVMKSVRSYEMMTKSPEGLMTNSERNEKTPTWDDILVFESALLADDVNLATICPAWLLSRVRQSRCALPRFINMLMFHVVFLTPVVESYDLDSSYLAVFPIIQRYADVLFSTTLEEAAVEEGKGVEVAMYCRRKLPKSRKSALGKFPVTAKVEKELRLKPDVVDREVLRKQFLSVLDVEEFDADLTSLPKDEQLFCLSLVLWLRNTTFPPSLEHLLAAIICHLVLYDIESLNDIKCRKRNPLEAELAKEKSKEKVALIEAKLSVLRFFSISGRVVQDRRCYDPEIVTYQEALKGIASWVASLGSLFSDPVEDLRPGRHFSGVFFYTFVAELRTKPNPIAFVKDETLLGCQPLLDHFWKLMKVVLPHGLKKEGDVQEILGSMQRISGARGAKKKKRARNKNKGEPAVGSDSEEVDSEKEQEDVDDLVYDEENRFAALKV